MVSGIIETLDSRKLADLMKLIQKADSIISTLMEDVTVEP